MRKNTLKLAHPGVGSTGFIQVALLTKVLGANGDFIPYRGAGPMLQDIIAGHVDMGTVTLQNAVEPVKSGLIKGMGISAKEPSKLLPQVPSIVTAIHPSLEVVFWNVLLAPAGTPKPVIDKLNAELKKVLADPGVASKLTSFTLDPMHMTPEQFAQRIKSDYDKYEKVVKLSAARID